MQIQIDIRKYGFAMALSALLLLSPVTHAAEPCPELAEPIVIRRTIPDPFAVRRAPLTSDRLSTTSTRYIDARRGFRPYSSVHGHDLRHHQYAAYDDHFGISRPEDRPYSYAHRTPRTTVTQFRNDGVSPNALPMLPANAAAYTLILREREAAPAPDMTIRVHQDTSAIPTTTGAVLITADGTVIQVGD